MSDSMFFPEEGARERGIKRLFAKATFGSGTVSASSGTGATITRSTNGTYTITMADAYSSLKACNIIFNANSATPVDLVPQVYDVSVPSGKTVKFKLLTGTVATDPSSGAEVYVELVMKDTGVTY